MNPDEFNDAVRQWGRATREEVRQALASVGAKNTGRLIREVNVRMGQQFGRANRVTFGFPRYLVWVEKSAGKGYGGKKGSRWTTNGETRRTNKGSLGKMGTGARPARPAFNPVMDRRVPVLASIAAQFWADAAVKGIDIM